MLDSFKLACVQVSSGDNLEENIGNALNFARKTINADAHLVAFPECVSMMAFGCEAVHRNAFSEDLHPGLAAFSSLARETRSWLPIG